MNWGAAARGLQATTQLVSGANAWAEFFNHVSSVISSACSRFINIQQRPDKSDEHQMQEDMRLLQSNLWQLQTTLPKMHDLVEQLEWQSHKKAAVELLFHVKDIVCDAEDLLDEFHYYELKVKVEQRVDDCQTLPAFQDFFSSVIQGGFNKVKQIQDKLDHLYGQSRDMGLHNAPQRFDKEVRPETSSFPNVSKFFGREEEVRKVIELLGVLPNSDVGFKRKRGNSVDGNSVDVLSIVGLGGVGKTTLAQQVYNSRRIKAHFDMTLWTCVSDEFDVKRLTKEVIESSRNEASVNNLDSLQAVLTGIVRSKRFLLVLDDIWDEVLKDDGQEWRRFCAPLSNARQGSMILVTTRSQIVADKVRTMDSFPLEGLKDDVFWEFFKLQAFGSQSANNHPELEDIGRSIAEKLKGSPLAAKTVGRLLSRNLHTTHWNNILYSELWKLEQQKTDILPALRLSYMYLPPHLKKCFSFCAVYPKDHVFQKDILADIWVAEGFVQRQNGIPITTVSCQYFEDLLSRSFFQKASVSSDKYVIHDLMHDMAQLVSGDECFIIRDSNDLQNIPRNVRHLSIFAKRNIGCRDLMGLRTYKKLRTLICDKTFGPKAFAQVVDIWFTELQRIRVLISTFSRQREIPESIGNLKHLRYLYLTGACTIKSAPSSLNCLYNLEILDVSKCEFESLPIGFSHFINLRKLKSKNFNYASEKSQFWQFVRGHGFISTLKHTIQIDVNLRIHIDHLQGNENVARVKLDKKNDLNTVTVSLHVQGTSGQELAQILEILHPHSNIKELQFSGYRGDFWPSWFQPVNLPNLKKLKFARCCNIPDITVSTFQFLEVLEILDCPSISWQKGFVLPSSLRRLSLVNCGDVSEWVLACLVNLTSLVHLQLIGLWGIISIPGDIWRNSLQFLDYLEISDCEGLLRIHIDHLQGNENVARVELDKKNDLNTVRASSLGQYNSGQGLAQILEILHPHSNIKELQFSGYTGDFWPSWFQPVNLPNLKKLKFARCCNIPDITVSTFQFLEVLEILDCPSISWQKGFVLPSSLRRLSLVNCGDVSEWVLACLVNLTSLVHLQLIGLLGIISIPGDIWRNSLQFLDYLEISDCEGLLRIHIDHLQGNENVARVELDKKNDLDTVRASLLGQHTSGQELAQILEILHPHSNIKELQFIGYTGDFWPSWFQPVNLPNLKWLKFEGCYNIPGTLPCTGFQFLEVLEILYCPSISWQKGFVLPSSLRRLSLVRCGDVSEWVPACLVNLTSLVHLQLIGLIGIISIPGDIWRNSLQFLDYLQIYDCEGLLSIGEPEAIAQINNVGIHNCPMLNGLEQPFRTGDSRWSDVRHLRRLGWTFT